MSDIKEGMKVGDGAINSEIHDKIWFFYIFQVKRKLIFKSKELYFSFKNDKTSKRNYYENNIHRIFRFRTKFQTL